MDVADILAICNAVEMEEAAVHWQGIANADWNTYERHGGLNAITGKILQTEDATMASNGTGWIDDFRVWGSRTDEY